jgi:predicted metal-dependent hydrolase
MITNSSTIKIKGISVEVTQKDIKNIHLSVYPPNGQVKVSAPLAVPMENLRAFILSKLSWIKAKRAKLYNQEREALRDFVNRESHYFKGKRYLLEVFEVNEPPNVSLSHSKIKLQVRPNSSATKKLEVMDQWYREQLMGTLDPIVKKWEKVIGVSVSKTHIRKMKTKWGSSSPKNKAIRINLELAKKPLECLEYITLHEMLHLIEPSHNDRFIQLMNKHMPKWRMHRDELNRLPVRHDEWKN